MSGLSGFAYLKSRWYYIGVNPAESTVVYSDRQEHPPQGGWELVEIAMLANGRYTVRFVDANVWLSQQPDGRFETRPVVEGEAPGDFEQFAGGILDDGPAKGLAILGPFVVEEQAA